MIWVYHDFYSNFTHSVKSDNIDLSLDIFRSEISDLLTYKSEVLYTLFDKLKIKYKKTASYEELLEIVLREIKSNDKFIRGLSFLIGESNDAIKKNSKLSWEKVLNGITKVIKRIGKYFSEHPKQENLFRKRAMEMVGTKSSIMGDDSRQLKKKDNTVLWILGVVAVGVAGYFVWRYFDNITQERMRAESLRPKLEMGGIPDNVVSAVPQNAPVSAPIIPEMPKPAIAVATPRSTDPAYNVPADVLIPIAQPAPIVNSSVVGSPMAQPLTAV